MIIYGIDPGFSGAIAIWRPLPRSLHLYDMPILKNAKGKTELDLHTLFDLLAPEDDAQRLAVVEQVGAMRGQGVSSMFRFGEGFGMLQMGCAANKLPVQFVTPAKWKGYFGLSRDKGVSRGLAMQRFPDNASDFGRAKDDGRAEAALLCLYAAENMV